MIRSDFGMILSDIGSNYSGIGMIRSDIGMIRSGIGMIRSEFGIIFFAFASDWLRYRKRALRVETAPSDRETPECSGTSYRSVTFFRADPSHLMSDKSDGAVSGFAGGVNGKAPLVGKRSMTRAARRGACRGKETEMTDTNTPAPLPDAPAVTAATTTEAIAAKIRAAIALLQSLVPGFLKYDARESKRIAASAKFGADSIMPTIGMVTTVQGRARNLFDVDEGQLTQELKDQLSPLVKQVEEFAADFQFTLDSRMANVAVQALQTYKWAQHAAKQPDGAPLHSYVAQMSAVVKKTQNKRKKAKTAAPAPTPGPAKPAGTTGAQGFLASNLVPKKTSEADDVADRFEQALKDVTE
jgi:hypothetical protein